MAQGANFGRYFGDELDAELIKANEPWPPSSANSSHSHTFSAGLIDAEALTLEGNVTVSNGMTITSGSGGTVTANLYPFVETSVSPLPYSPKLKHFLKVIAVNYKMSQIWLKDREGANKFTIDFRSGLTPMYGTMLQDEYDNLSFMKEFERQDIKLGTFLTLECKDVETILLEHTTTYEFHLKDCKLLSIVAPKDGKWFRKEIEYRVG